MNSKFLDTILYHQAIKNIVNYFINKSFIYNNFLYRYLHNKKINFVINKYKIVPYSLRIENTNFCNGQCFMCPHPTMTRKKGTMSKDLYKKIINQASNLKINYINLHNFGEPLIDKDFIWRINYAKSKNINRISTNTNGVLLSSKLSKSIIKSGLDELFISIDAATKKTYQKIRIGLDYDRLLKNIRHLIMLKKLFKSDKPKIILDFLEFDLNRHETKIFINKWKKIVDQVCISQIHDWSNKKQINISKSTNNYVQFSHSPCRLPFTEMLINWDGKVSLCCQDIDGEVILGDANYETILTIWQNKKYQEIRNLHLQLDVKNLLLCKNCKLRTFWWIF